MIAGFCELDSGEIRFGAQRIDPLPAHRRNIGMVFQNYAIFPNLTVAGNVAYGLKARKVAAAEIAQRVEEALALVQLTGYGARWPHQLSGGQLQRVAIARALVIQPGVLLLDEPLSNLDARLRVSMRGEIRELQKSLGITAIYVTHDQEEAMSVSDRIAVMRAGAPRTGGRARRHLPPAGIALRRRVHGHDQSFRRAARSAAAAMRWSRSGPRRCACCRCAAGLAGAGRIGGAGRAAGAARAPRRAAGRRHDAQGRRARCPGDQVQAGAALTLAYDPARLTVLP